MLFLGLVSPDASLCGAIAEQIKRAAIWQLAIFASLEEALAAWSEALPPVIFWDAQNCADKNETILELARRLHAAEDPSRLIALGADSSFPIEATDNYARPLRLGALLSRLQFYEKALQQTPDQPLPLGGWKFNPRRRTLSPVKEGAPLRLTDKEAALLSALYQATEGFSREALLQDVWGYNSQADTHTIETHIYRLRRKLMSIDVDGSDCFIAESGRYSLNPVWRIT